VVILFLIYLVRNLFFCPLAAQGVVLKLLKQNDYLNHFYGGERFLNESLVLFHKTWKHAAFITKTYLLSISLRVLGYGGG
jgi:hypothetical protein